MVVAEANKLAVVAYDAHGRSINKVNYSVRDASLAALSRSAKLMGCAVGGRDFNGYRRRR